MFARGVLLTMKRQLNYGLLTEEIKMRYLVLFILSGVAYANDKKEEPKVVYKERTEIDFESVEVSGELVRPQGSLVLERKRAQFNSMIKLRTDFDDEMDKSVDEIK
jgi:hypothetical protein